MNPVKKVAIIGGSFWGNRGAAAMLETTIGKICEKNPETLFSIFTPYPKIDPELVNRKDFQFYDSKPLGLIKLNFLAILYWLMTKFGLQIQPWSCLKSIKDATVLLDIGGITFADGRLVFLPYNILTILPALIFSVPVIKLSQAAGSFKNPIIRVLARYFLPKCDFTFARGEQTLSFLKQLGLNEDKVTLAMDATFVYEPSFCLTNENDTATQQIVEQLVDFRNQKQTIIGISPSVLVMDKMTSNQTDYIDYLIDIVRKLSFEKNVYFVIFPNASRERSKKKRNNDILVIEEMQFRSKQELPFSLYKNILWLTFDIDTKGINSIVNELDLLITSRFHAMVFGLRLAIPTLVIGWSHKYLEVMKFFDQEKYVFDYGDANQSIDMLIREIINENQTIRSQIRNRLTEATALSQIQFNYLERYLV